MSAEATLEAEWFRTRDALRRAAAPVAIEGRQTLPDEPVGFVEGEPKEGIALCLSGGGYRAMLFDLGAVWRLNDAGYLPRLDRISSVSAGSVVAGVLAQRWSRLSFDDSSVSHDFVPEVVEPIRHLAERTIDAPAMLLSGWGWLGHGRIGSRLAGAYRKHLFGQSSLQDLGDRPRFAFSATNLQTGGLMRFSKPYIWDYRLSLLRNPRTALADVVAASSAQTFRGSVVLRFRDTEFESDSGLDRQQSGPGRVVLADGSLFDSLALESAWARYGTILISDGGGIVSPMKRPRRVWQSYGYRMLDTLGNQVAALRKRQAVAAFRAGLRRGTYWSIRSDIANFQLADALPCARDKTTRLANLPTRLASLDIHTQEQLINWGFASCDAALRAHVDSSVWTPVDFPYPSSALS